MVTMTASRKHPWSEIPVVRNTRGQKYLWVNGEASIELTFIRTGIAGRADEPGEGQPLRQSPV
jgi:hypothetical protein